MDVCSGQVDEEIVMTIGFFEGEWWKKASASIYFSKELLKYFVQLYISYRLDGRTKRESCTGIIVEVNGRLLWISAGHVVQAIIYHYEHGMVNDIRWIDRWETPGVETLPFVRREIKYLLGVPKGADYGAILLSILEAEYVRKNKNIRPLVMRSGVEGGRQEPEGFVLAGFPNEKVDIGPRPGPPGKELIRLSSELVCLPLAKKAWEEISTHEENWSDNEAFYGQILAYSDKDDAQPEDLKGMSGGPVFSFYRELNTVNIELEAIFDSYLPESRQIRAEPTTRVFEDIESWLSELR